MATLTNIYDQICGYFEEQDGEAKSGKFTNAEILLRHIQEEVVGEIADVLDEKTNKTKEDTEYIRLGGIVKHKVNGKMMVITNTAVGTVGNKVSCRYESHFNKEFVTMDFYVHELKQYCENDAR